MFEHVGTPHYQEFFNKVYGLLNQKGVALIHTIGRIDKPTTNDKWIEKYIFPGGMLPSQIALKEQIEKAGLKSIKVDKFGQSYSKTLRIWHNQFNSGWTDIAHLGFDDRFRRMWNFYFASCAAFFLSQTGDVAQLTLQKG